MDKRVRLVFLAVVLGVGSSVWADDTYIDPGTINVTASSVNYQLEAIYTCNGNGLSGDLHTNNIGGEPPAAGQGTMWLSNGIAGEWIEYEFDRAYAINSMWVWNYNQNNPERTTRGIRDCTIEYSLDGAAWEAVGGTHTFAKADGSDNYAHNTEIDFGGAKAQYVKITVVSNHGGSSAGLSEVRFYAGDSVGFEMEASSDVESVTPAEIAVVLTNGQAEAVTVDYAVSGGTAAAGQDFALEAGTLVFNPGETVKTISINIVNDGADEDDETIELTLSNASGGEVELGTAEHIYTIVDPRPAIGFDAAAGGGPENVQIIHRARKIAVSLSWAGAERITVDYGPTGGTAIRGQDYEIEEGTLSFAPGELTKYVYVTIVDDDAAESDETLVVSLSNPAGAKFGANTQHTYTIADDDTGAEPPNRDLNSDGTVDYKDVIVFLDSWLDCTLYPPELCWE